MEQTKQEKAAYARYYTAMQRAALSSSRLAGRLDLGTGWKPEEVVARDAILKDWSWLLWQGQKAEVDWRAWLTMFRRVYELVSELTLSDDTTADFRLRLYEVGAQMTQAFLEHTDRDAFEEFQEFLDLEFYIQKRLDI